jgi:hypothetical protein
MQATATIMATGLYRWNKQLDILVFKTNLETDHDRTIIAPVLNAHPFILKWNVDKHDIDKVLRIVTNNLAANDIIRLLHNEGYYCEELPD